MSAITPLDNNMNNPIPVATIMSYGTAFLSFISGGYLQYEKEIDFLVGLALSLLGATFMVLTYFTNRHYKKRNDARQERILELKEKAYSRANQDRNET